MRQFNYSSHDWIQTSALTHRATLLRNAKVILVSWSVGIKVKDFSLVLLAVWSDGSKFGPTPTKTSSVFGAFNSSQMIMQFSTS